MIRDVASTVEPVHKSVSGAAVYDRFSAEPDTPAIAVVDDEGAPVGLVERNAFALKMAAEFGRALFGRRPVTAVMDPHPVLLEADTPVEVLMEQAAGAPRDLLKGFVVVESGRYFGVGTALTLIVAAAEESRRRAAEMKRREEESRFLFEHNPVPMYVLERPTWRILRFNEAAAEQFSSTVATIDAGASVLSFVGQADQDSASERLAGGRSLEQRSEPIEITDGRGRLRQVTPYTRTMRFEDREAVLTAVVDVTERKEALDALAAARDAAEAASRAKTEFLANMSHEIRTPINGVLGLASALGRTSLDPRQRDMVTSIEESAESLQVLLSDVLDLFRVEAGRMEFVAEPMCLGGAVRSIAELFRAKAEEKGLTFDVDAGDAERWVRGDAVRIKQILGNLLSNAVKFTQRGSVRLTVRAEEGDVCRFCVTDSGVGFDSEFHARLFGRFEQADGSVNRRFGGTGLGLAISRTLADLMGGRLEARSQPGEGSTFELVLPLEPAAAPALARHVEAPLEVEAQAGRPVRILLAEDHPINRKVVAMILADADVDLTAVENGRDAVEQFSAQPFDVVLMDMQMPVMDGLAATRAVRAFERERGRVPTPLIMLTANALPEHEAAGLEAGADFYVRKPISAPTLFGAIDAALTLAADRAEQAEAA